MAHLAKVYWPAGISEPGWIIGYNIRSLTACVITVAHDISLAKLSELLDQLSSSPEFSNLWKHCGGPPSILGELVVRKAESRVRDPSLGKFKQQADIWITVESTGSPWVRDVRCCGYRYRVTAQIILYNQPASNSWIASEPLSLETKAHQEPPAKLTDLDYILRQISISLLLERYLREQLRHPDHIETVSDVQEGTDDPVQSLSNALSSRDDFRLLHRMWRQAADATSRPLSFIWHIIEQFMLSIIWFVNYPIFGSATLRSYSCILQQLHFRVSSMMEWRSQYENMRKAGVFSHYGCAVKHHFNNSVWLLIDDVLMGVIICWFVTTHVSTIIASLEWTVPFINTDLLADQMRWLMGWPAGFKLNDELDEFFAAIFLYFLSCWKYFFSYITPYVPTLIKMFGFCGIFGVSALVAILHDVVALLFIHVFAFYKMVATIYSVQVSVLRSLWHLFRGHKVNILRMRIDSCDYALDQLLLGTLFFTINIFLIPTTTFYYLFFVFDRLFIVIVLLFLNTCLILVNHFPMYDLMLRVFTPTALPGGIRLEPLDSAIVNSDEWITMFDQPRLVDRIKGWFTSKPPPSPPSSPDTPETPTPVTPVLPSPGPNRRRRITSTRPLNVYFRMQAISLPFFSLFFHFGGVIKALFSHYMRQRIHVKLLTGAHIEAPN